MPKIISEDEKAMYEKEKKEEIIKIRRQIAITVEEIRDKLGKLTKAVEELKKVRSENVSLKRQVEDLKNALKSVQDEPIKEEVERLKRELEEMKRALDVADEERRRLEVEYNDVRSALQDTKTRLRATEDSVEPMKNEISRLTEERKVLSDEVERLKLLLKAKEEEILLTKDILQKTIAYKNDLEDRVRTLSTELQSAGQVTTALPVEEATPVFRVVDEEEAQHATMRPLQNSDVQRRRTGRILSGAPTRSLLRPRDQANTRGLRQVARIPETRTGIPSPSEQTVVTPSTPQRGDTCPVCEGEGIVGVRRSDGSIVEERCPNCDGAGRV